MKNSRDIAELKPALRDLALAWLIACRAEGIDAFIISTYRDDEYQNFIYEQGRTRQGHIVTNAKAGESEHNKRNAFDFAIKVAGVVTWTDIRLYERAGIIAEKLGMVWGGRFKKIKDYGHIQGK